MFRYQQAAVFALVVLSTTALAVAIHGSLVDYQDSLEFGAFAAMVALLGCAAYSVREQVRAAQLQRRRARSLEILDQLNEWDSVRRRIQLQSEVASRGDEQWWTTHDQLNIDAQWLLGIFEDLSLTVRSGVADEALLRDSLGSIVPVYYETCKAFIEGRRDAEEDPALYIRFEELANCWREGKSLQTGDWLPTLFAPREWQDLERVRKRVIRSRRWIFGLSVSMVPMTLLWILFRLTFCWDVGTCNATAPQALCLLCSLDDVVRVGLVLVGCALAWLLFDLFTLGGTLQKASLFGRLREGSRNLSGTWEPEKGSGPGLWTVATAVLSVCIAFYLYFVAFETYYDVDDFPDAVIEEGLIDTEPGPTIP